MAININPRGTSGLASSVLAGQVRRAQLDKKARENRIYKEYAIKKNAERIAGHKKFSAVDMAEAMNEFIAKKSVG